VSRRSPPGLTGILLHAPSFAILLNRTLKISKRKNKIIAAGVEGVREKRVTKGLLRSLYHAENSQPKLLVHWPASVY
jgi:hypothetical protein